MLCADLVTPSQSQGHWKWCKTVEVNGAYRHGMYKRNWLKSLPVKVNVKLFAKRDGWTASRMNATHYIDPYVTHMDPWNNVLHRVSVICTGPKPFQNQTALKTKLFTWSCNYSKGTIFSEFVQRMLCFSWKEKSTSETIVICQAAGNSHPYHVPTLLFLVGEEHDHSREARNLSYIAKDPVCSVNFTWTETTGACAINW